MINRQDCEKCVKLSYCNDNDIVCLEKYEVRDFAKFYNKLSEELKKILDVEIKVRNKIEEIVKETINKRPHSDNKIFENILAVIKEAKDEYSSFDRK